MLVCVVSKRNRFDFSRSLRSYPPFAEAGGIGATKIQNFTIGSQQWLVSAGYDSKPTSLVHSRYKRAWQPYCRQTVRLSDGHKPVKIVSVPHFCSAQQFILRCSALATPRGVLKQLHTSPSTRIFVISRSIQIIWLARFWMSSTKYKIEWRNVSNSSTPDSVKDRASG